MLDLMYTALTIRAQTNGRKSPEIDQRVCNLFSQLISPDTDAIVVLEPLCHDYFNKPSLVLVFGGNYMA